MAKLHSMQKHVWHARRLLAGELSHAIQQRRLHKAAQCVKTAPPRSLVQQGLTHSQKDQVTPPEGPALPVAQRQQLIQQAQQALLQAQHALLQMQQLQASIEAVSESCPPESQQQPEQSPPQAASAADNEIHANLRDNFLQMTRETAGAQAPKLAQKTLAGSLHRAQQKLGYKFRYPGLLHLAFNHASVDGRGSYALAWLGDAALMMIVTEQMGVLYPGQERGDFSTLRSHAISRATCAARAEKLGLGEFIVLGNSTPKVTANMLAELFEAVLGAIYVDGGWQESRKVFLSHFAMSPDIREALAEYGCKSVLDMTHSEKVQKAMPKSAIRMKAYLMSQQGTKARRSKH